MMTMDLDPIFTRRFIQLESARVAYVDEGSGPAVLFLHGCPFSSHIWERLIAGLRGHFRCVAPDLLGLGDTETAPDADWALPAQAAMIMELLDRLGLRRVHVVGHDHGGAVAQLLAAANPQVIDCLVLVNVEAFDNWPSRDERPFIVATQLPVIGRFVLWLWSFPAMARLALLSGAAVHDRHALSGSFVRGFVRANLRTHHRRMKTRRFLAGQLDPSNNRHTATVLDKLRTFDRPTMIVWGEADPHFGPDWGRRLYEAIPGATRLEMLPDTGHLVMEERLERLADLLREFLGEPSPGATTARKERDRVSAAATAKREVHRRQALLIGAAFIAGTGVGRGHEQRETPAQISRMRFQVPLPLPPVLAPARTNSNADYEIRQLERRIEIFPGASTTVWGYEGLFPGPTIRARRGRKVVIRHVNELSHPTLVHLHGTVVPGDSDGFPTDVIVPGASRTYTYPNEQRTATLWYHDHAMHHTGRNRYMGLAGLYVIDDEEQRALNLPNDEYAVPLVIQAKQFRRDGSMVYDAGFTRVMGARSNTVLVNGAPWPRFEVAARKYRFRILNASNATPLRLALASEQPLLQVGTDGGLLEAPVVSSSIPLSMAERIEIVIDFSIYAPGTNVVLRNLRGSGAMGEIMRFDVVRRDRDDSVVPERLCTVERVAPERATQTRRFVFKGSDTFDVPPLVWPINGKHFDPDQALAAPRHGDVEIWHLVNRKAYFVLGLLHPVHTHLAPFQVLDRNGRAPLAHDGGWKDTIALERGEEAHVVIRFDSYRGRYLMHCHNLEHEDHAMMTRFDVV
jgi:FtsP/CotA-like multicopper oxidase with cupredoxin domain/pimeloyl-ACP methyl ester carboxylesterase